MSVPFMQFFNFALSYVWKQPDSTTLTHSISLYHEPGAAAGWWAVDLAGGRQQDLPLSP